ncbi:MAG TPA: glycosyltransferase family 39 protein [Acidobacteriota bacterium]
MNAIGVYQLGQDVPGGRELSENVFRYYVNDNHPPFYFILLGLWLNLFGMTEFSARMLSVLINLITLPVVYLLAWQIFKDRKVSLVACLIFGFSPYLVYFSQEARMYSLLLLLSSLSMLFFLKIQERADWRSYAAFVLFSILGIYTHYYYVFLFCFQIFYWIFFGDDRVHEFLLSLSIIVLCFIPWIPVLLYQIAQKNQSDLWIRNNARGGTVLWQGIANSLTILFRFAAGESYAYPSSTWGLRVMCWVVGVLFIVILLQRPFLLRQRHGRMLTLWLLFPLMSGLAADVFFRTKTLEISKYFIVSYPAMLLILGVSVVRFRWKYCIPILLAALVILNAKALGQYYETPKAVEWRDVARYLSSTVGTDDAVLSTDAKVSNCIGFYLEKRLNIIEVPYGSTIDYILKSARKNVASSQKLWMVSVYEPYTPKLQDLSQRMEQNFPLLSQHVVAEHAIVRSFARPKD